MRKGVPHQRREVALIDINSLEPLIEIMHQQIFFRCIYIICINNFCEFILRQFNINLSGGSRVENVVAQINLDEFVLLSI